MICIIFKLRAELPPKAQDRLLENIAAWDSRNRAGRLYVGAQSIDKRSLYYIYAADDGAARSTLKRLQETYEVEYAHIPSARVVAHQGH